MTFKYYELRLQAGADDTYEIIKWNKHNTSCSVICFLKYDDKKRCYDVEKGVCNAFYLYMAWL